MRKLLAVLGAMLLLGGSAIGVMAQDATPAAGVDAGNAADPAIGDTVTYIDESGNPMATVTIDDVERGWKDFGEYDEPDAGNEYVAMTVTVTSEVGRGSLEVSDFDFSLQDSDGFLWGTAYADAAEGVEIVPLEDDLNLASGESATFLVVFQVLEGQQLTHVFWQPDSGRLLTLASLESV
jgi:hypothetical protein